MDRRALLGGIAAGAAGSLAGCLETLGFETESAWRDPPLVDDRPAAVYVPASSEEMGVYGADTDGEYAVELSYTFPHRFWLVAGDETETVTVETDDTLHLMCTVWDPETDTVLPTELDVELRRNGDAVRRFTPWPMLSQRMGFHFGDNVALPEEGTYTASIRVGPLGGVEPVGGFDGRFESASTLEIEFEFDRADIHDLAFETVPDGERGQPGALSLMAHGGHGGGDGRSDGGDGHGSENGHGGQNETGGHGGQDADVGSPPSSAGVPIEDLEGTHLGTESSADAAVSVLETDAERLTGGSGTYLATFVRTPHNGVILPMLAVRLSLERDGAVLEEEPLTEAVDPELGHHYGLVVDGVAAGDRLTVAVEGDSQVARHDGYETAFFDFEPVAFDV